MFKKILLLFIYTFLYNVSIAHFTNQTGELHKFQIGNHTIEGYFYMLKNDIVYIENKAHQILQFPLHNFSRNNQIYFLNRYEQISALQKLTHTPTKKISYGNLQFTFITIGMFFFLLFVIIYYHKISTTTSLSRIKFIIPVFMVGICSVLVHADKHFRSTTDPNVVDKAFIPFKPNVYTRWDANWFYIESKGIPSTHIMSVGISDHGWQQQVPVPQCYTGNNAWQIPLNPIMAATPVPVSPNHFTRGAIAIAVNGVPIFNPYTNTGVDALVDGQLDNFGGHCGRADDYHYHIAPLHLYNYTADTLPIAYALDGFAVYGSKESDGTPMLALDSNHGHFYAGIYHYHGTSAFPYMVGKMVGHVTEDTTMQIVPQAHANPIRPSGTPLNGALITGCTPNANNNGYIFTYTLNGDNYTIEYSWNSSGTYTFNYISPGGTTTAVYNDFTQCNLPTAIVNLSKSDKFFTLFPNPVSNTLNINYDNEVDKKLIQQISIYNFQGQCVFNATNAIDKIITSSFISGIYVVKIKYANQVFTKKIQIK